MIKIGLALSIIGAGLLLGGPLGTRFGLWSFIIGFLMLGLSVLLALVGASLALIAGVKTGQWALAAIGIVIGLTSAAGERHPRGLWPEVRTIDSMPFSISSRSSSGVRVNIQRWV